MYRLWDPERKKPFKSRDVVFKENEFLERDAFQNISQDFSPLVIEFNDLPDNEPEDLSEPPTLANNSVNDGFTTPKHPARPQYLPPTPPTPLATPPNRYALLAPIPPTPVPEPDYESDSDDENDDLPQCATPDTESDTPSTPPLADVQSDPISNQSSESASPSNSETSPSDISPLPEMNPQTSSTPYPARIRKPSEKAREAKETEKLIQEQRSKPRTKATSTDTSANRTSPFEPPNEPKSTEEARASPQAQQWHDAEIEEINSLNEREVWNIVRRPTNQHVMDCKFAYRLKDAHTSKPRYKARLVARGFTEVPGVDYTDTFAPVAKPASVRLVFATCAAKKLHAHNFDVKTAYLYSDVERLSYIEQPPGFELPGCPRDEWTYQINKGLYGRHDSGRLWYETVKNKLRSLHFERSFTDECVFILENSEHYIIIAVYVDDFLVAAKSLDDVAWIHGELNKDWETRDLGPVKRFLGVDVHRPDPTGAIFINQGIYARQVLHEFEMQNCNPVKTPLNPSIKLHKRLDEEPAADGEPYRRMTGKIMHLAVYTRPDLAFASSKQSQFNSNPSEIHMKAIKHVLRYINGTLDHGILYSSPDSTLSLPVGFCDASFDTDPDDSKSTSGWLYMLSNGAISWGSKKQDCIALSTMESEAMAMTEAAKEAIFLQNLLESLNLSKRDEPILLKTDSESAYNHVKNNVNHPRTKHIQRHHRFIREVYENGEIDIERIPSEEQAADVLTKALSHIKHD